MSFYKKVNKSIEEDLSLITCDDRHIIEDRYISEGRYKIYNKDSGTYLGKYKGRDELDAYQDMLKDAGYSPRNLPPGQKRWDVIPDDIEVLEESFSDGSFLSESIDKHAIRELEIYIDNDSKLYDDKINSFYKNLILKICQGKYDSKKAIKLFMYLVERAAKAYSKELGSGTWNIDFPKKEREEVARGLVADFESAVKNDEFDWVGDGLVPKKYANINLAKSLKQGRPVMEGRRWRNKGSLRESGIVRYEDRYISEGKYEIYNKDSGVSLGVYRGEDELDAYQNMLRDARYSPRNLPPGQKRWDVIPRDIEVNEI